MIVHTRIYIYAQFLSVKESVTKKMPKRARSFSTSRVAKKRRTVSMARRRRRLWKSTRGTSLGRSLGFPRMLKFKHKYTENFTLTSSTTTAHYHFCANGMYDPNITGTGHQPMYFDQLSEIYNHYHVIGSQCKFTVVPVGTTAQVPYRVITWINDDTTNPGTNALEEQKGAQTRLCQGGLNPDKLFFKQNWSAKRYFGNVMANDSLKGTTSTNPSEISVFHIALRPLDEVTSVSVYVRVEITYIAIWNELKDAVAS